jgi:hypothetical protein
MTQHPTDPGLIAQGGSEAAVIDILDRFREQRDKSSRGLPWGLADEMAAEISHLHSWDGLMSLLDEHWPQSIFPTTLDHPARDPGPRIVSLLRWVDNLRAQVELQTAEVERLRGALEGLAAKWASCDEIAECESGGCWEAFRECAEQLRAALRGDQ